MEFSLLSLYADVLMLHSEYLEMGFGRLGKVGPWGGALMVGISAS